MPLRCTIDHARRFVSVTGQGQVILQDVLDCCDRLVVEGAMPYAKLFDASDVELQFSDDDVMVLAARASAYAAFDPRGPLALVAGTDEAKNLMRRFMNLGHAKRPMMLFGRVEHARSWLRRMSDA